MSALTILPEKPTRLARGRLVILSFFLDTFRHPLATGLLDLFDAFDNILGGIECPTRGRTAEKAVGACGVVLECAPLTKIVLTRCDDWKLSVNP